MTRYLIRAAIYLVTAVLGLLLASWWIDGVALSGSGFVLAVVVFTIVQVLVSPAVLKLTREHASALIGGVGLISTFIALLAASLPEGGLKINGIASWSLTTLVVWLVTAVGTWVLSSLLLPDPASTEAS